MFVCGQPTVAIGVQAPTRMKPCAWIERKLIIDISVKRERCRQSCRRGRRRHRLPTSKRSEEHTSELQSLMRISYAVFCLQKKQTNHRNTQNTKQHVKQSTQTLTKLISYQP